MGDCFAINDNTCIKLVLNLQSHEDMEFVCKDMSEDKDEFVKTYFV